MANVWYPKYKEALLSGGSDTSLITGTVKAALIDTGTYTYSSAHQFLSDLSGVVGTAVTLGTKTVLSGLFDAADAVFTAVTGVDAEAIVIYIDTGVAATSRLVLYMDTGIGGIPVTPNGTDITIAWNASGIAQL